MDFLEDELHVGAVLSIVVDVKKEVIEIAEQLEEDAEELAMARYCYSFIYGDESSLTDALGKIRGCLRFCNRDHDTFLAFIQVIVRLTCKTVVWPTGSTANTAIVTSGSTDVVKLRVIAKGLYLEVDEICVVENHKVMTTCIYFQLNWIDYSNTIRDRTAILQIDNDKFRSIS